MTTNQPKTITPDFMTFEQWLENNPDIQEEAKEEDCLECGGDGEVKCFSCGHTADCGECDGTGKIKTNEALELYEKQLERDKKMLQKYMELTAN